MIGLNSSHFQLLERTLDAASLRQKVIANNIANAETPFFKRSDVRFEEYLQDAISSRTPAFAGLRTDPRHLYIGNPGANVEPQIETDANSVMNNNMNNVDIDSEMSLMAKNQLRYNTLIQQVNHEIRMMKTAVEGK